MLSQYHAVSVKPANRYCKAVKQVNNQRFLSNEAPRLPLSGCSSPKQCACRYLHHTDRRDDARRDCDAGMPDRYFAGPNRRERTGRRQTDAA
jgi:hypothetical protein